MKRLIFLLTFLVFILTGCDNNEGPFTTKMKNGHRVLYSGDSPAKGWIQNTIYNNYQNTETTVSEIYYEDGIPNGDFKLYNKSGELIIEAEGKWKNNLFKGKVKYPSVNGIGKGLFEIRRENLMLYKGGGLYNTIFLEDGEYSGDDGEFTRVKGKYDGKYLEKYNGKILKEVLYENGKSLYVKHFSSGELIKYSINTDEKYCIYEYKDGIPTSEYYRIEGELYSRKINPSSSGYNIIETITISKGKNIDITYKINIEKDQIKKYLKKNKIEDLGKKYSKEIEQINRYR